MHLFTWNIDKRLAMTRYAVTHLERVAERDFVVAALQEWPWRPLPEMNNHPLTTAGARRPLCFAFRPGTS
jgi:hypothetical protein